MSDLLFFASQWPREEHCHGDRVDHANGTVVVKASVCWRRAIGLMIVSNNNDVEYICIFNKRVAFVTLFILLACRGTRAARVSLTFLGSQSVCVCV